MPGQRKNFEYIWMKITTDEYELPMAVAGTCEELAELLGITKNTIQSMRSHYKRDGRKCPYILVKIPKRKALS